MLLPGLFAVSRGTGHPTMQEKREKVLTARRT